MTQETPIYGIYIFFLEPMKSQDSENPTETPAIPGVVEELRVEEVEDDQKGTTQLEPDTQVFWAVRIFVVSCSSLFTKNGMG